MKKYEPGKLEPKWQKNWKDSNLYTADLAKPNKFYVLAEFPYTSGNLHMGHWFTYAAADFYARLKRMQGHNVFFPNGFDAFGLPAENAAIKNGIHPQDRTLENVDKMKQQFETMGSSATFDHEVVTCLPEYYKWNQWTFLRMFEKGLAYKGKYLSNWCNVCQTVLANEAVEAGTCWRCHTEVVQKPVDQWFYKITKYADRLIWPENPSIDWPKSVREAQNSWIGKSVGALIRFGSLEVFTTRPDTLFGATFVVISPEHQMLKDFLTSEQKGKVEKYVIAAKKKSELERKENKEKTGVFTGSMVKNPATGKDIPVWVADYVLPGYGTGAIMAVPAHDPRDFDFAKKFGLEIKQVIVRPNEVSGERSGIDESSRLRSNNIDKAYEGEGELINSGKFSGLKSTEAKEIIVKYLEEEKLGQKMVFYHLHDWSISRQRYWGTPIPIIYCDKCGMVPVPDEDLPIKLPYDVDYTPKGKPPLASNEDWLNVKCPKCEGPAKRDPETMDAFVDSSWYFFRYLDPKYDFAPFEKAVAKKTMPVDIYFGGSEHTLGHTLYARFMTKVFHDLGLTDLEEFAVRRVNHGIVLGADGFKMSKSRGNGVNPDEEVKKYGADVIRVYLAFFMPYEATGPWVPERIWGPYRFLERLWGLFEKVAKNVDITNGDRRIMHKTIKKVGDDIEDIKFNTAVASLMEWINYLSRKNQVSEEEYSTFLLLLAPFAPHITEELWEALGRKYSIHQQSWPKFDKKYLEEEELIIVIQVNGKVRDQITIQKDILSDKEAVEKKTQISSKVQKFLGGKEIKKSIYVPGKILNLVTG